MIRPHLLDSFVCAALSPDPDLAVAALKPYLDRLDALGCEARRRVTMAAVVPGGAPPHIDPHDYARVMALNDYLFRELRFVGNAVQYEDPRNSFLNDVLDRRTGIPITLALLYMVTRVPAASGRVRRQGSGLERRSAALVPAGA